MFFRIFLNKRNINVCAFKEMASMLLRRTRNDKPRTRPSGRFPTRAMRAIPAFSLLRIDVRPRECKCEIVVNPFFPRLSHRTVSARTFLLPHTSLASPSISAFRSSLLPLFSPLTAVILNIASLQSPADKLISPGKSCLGLYTFPTESRNSAPKISYLVFSCFSLRDEHVVSSFAFYCL